MSPLTDTESLEGPYRLLRPLGSDELGVLHEAAHVRMPGRFAIKILSPALLADEEKFARFCRDVMALSELRHPNLVQLLDLDITADGKPYVVTELLAGADVASRLARGGPFPARAALAIAKQAAAALEAAHRRGIVHGALRPQDLFLVPVEGSEDDLVKMLNIGVAPLRPEPGQIPGAVVIRGLPLYQAPEEAFGRSGAADPRADQFALGAIVYEMLAGWPAFGGEDPVTVLYRVLHEPPPPLPAGHPGHALMPILLRAMAKVPAERYPSMGELGRAFDHASDGLALGAPTLRAEVPVVRAGPARSARTPAGGARPPAIIVGPRPVRAEAADPEPTPSEGPSRWSRSVLREPEDVDIEYDPRVVERRRRGLGVLALLTLMLGGLLFAASRREAVPERWRRYVVDLAEVSGWLGRGTARPAAVPAAAVPSAPGPVAPSAEPHAAPALEQAGPEGAPGNMVMPRRLAAPPPADRSGSAL